MQKTFKKRDVSGLEAGRTLSKFRQAEENFQVFLVSAFVREIAKKPTGWTGKRKRECCVWEERDIL